jgi:enterochelin esterase-like enzyme
MVVDHTAGPSILYLLTAGNRFYSSAAEAFIFISGLLMGIVYRRLVERDGLGSTLWRSLERAVSLYLVTVTLSLLFIPVSELLRLPWALELDLHDPLRFVVSILTLHRTYYLVDIPLLYTLLLLVAPLALLLLAQRRTPILLVGSWLLWGAYQLFPTQADFPWHVADNYVFAFSAWQVFFFTGLVLGWHRRAVGEGLARFPRRAGVLAFGLGLWALIALSLFEIELRYPLDAQAGSDQVRQVQLFILDMVFAKADVRPGRIIASVILFGFFYLLITGLWRPLNRALGWFMIPLGQHALYAYMAHVLLMVPITLILQAVAGPAPWSGVVSLIAQLVVLLAILGLINLRAFTSPPRQTWLRAALPVGAVAACVVMLAAGTTNQAPAAASAQPVQAGNAGTRQGTMRELSFYSEALDREMPYLAYLPPGYDAERRRYPVLFLLHGEGGSYREWAGYNLAGIADRMIASREIQPMVVVLPQDDVGRTPAPEGAARYVEYVSRDLVRHVEATYRVLSAVPHRAIGGMSRGGKDALELAFSNPDVFPIVGAHRPSFPNAGISLSAQDTAPASYPLDLLALAQRRPDVVKLAIWIDVDRDNESLRRAAELHDALNERRIRHQWWVFPAGATDSYWAAHIPDYLRFYNGAFAQALRQPPA